MVFPDGIPAHYKFGLYDVPETNPEPADDALPDGASWEHDPGQAILDGRDDIDWQLNAAAVVYEADADDTPPVTAPTSAELDSQGMLEVLSEQEQLEYYHAQMSAPLHRRSGIEDRDFERREGYEQCVLDQQVLEEQSVAANSALLKAMGIPSAHKVGTAVTVLTSWHSGKYVLRDSSAVPVDRVVQVRLGSGSRFVDGLDGSSAISVHTVRRDSRQDKTEHVVLFDADDVPNSIYIEADDTTVPILPIALRMVAYNQLLPDAQAAGVEPWVDDYAALPAATGEISENEFFNHHYMPPALRAALVGGHEDRSDAAAALAKVFTRIGESTVRNVLATPLDKMMERMEELGAAERYVWLLKQYDKIRASVVQHENDALETGVRSAYREWYGWKETAIHRIAALAEELSRMPPARKSFLG
jgi:hypothetical protein